MNTSLHDVSNLHVPPVLPSQWPASRSGILRWGAMLLLALAFPSQTHAQILAQTDFTSTNQGTGFTGGWTTNTLFGNGAFGPTGFDTLQNYFLTTRGISGVSLSAAPTWIALQSTLESYTVPGSSAFFDFRLQMAGDVTSNLSLGANGNASPFTQPFWGSIFRNGGGFQGMYGPAVTPPAGPTTFLLRLTSDSTNIFMQSWTYYTALPLLDPTGGTNGASQYGSYSWASTGTGISGLRVEGNLNTASTQFVIAGDYADVVSVIPEPSTVSLLSLGLAGAAWALLRRRRAANGVGVQPRG